MKADCSNAQFDLFAARMSIVVDLIIEGNSNTIETRELELS